MAKIKISRPILYSLLALAVGLTWYFFSQPDTSPHRHIVIRTASAGGAALLNTPEDDLSAHFPRYVSRQRDPFAARVVLTNPAANAAAAAAKPSGGQGWALTGVNSINGVATAVVENSATNDLAFLKAGDRWNGLRVLKVVSDAVIFENALGQQTRLAFNLVEDDTTGPGAQRSAPAVAAAVPSAGPLPPLPVLSPSSRGNSQGNLSQP